MSWCARQRRYWTRAWSPLGATSRYVRPDFLKPAATNAGATYAWNIASAGYTHTTPHRSNHLWCSTGAARTSNTEAARRHARAAAQERVPRSPRQLGLTWPDWFRRAAYSGGLVGAGLGAVVLLQLVQTRYRFPWLAEEAKYGTGLPNPVDTARIMLHAAPVLRAQYLLVYALLLAGLAAGVARQRVATTADWLVAVYCVLFGLAPLVTGATISRSTGCSRCWYRCWGRLGRGHGATQDLTWRPAVRRLGGCWAPVQAWFRCPAVAAAGRSGWVAASWPGR